MTRLFSDLMYHLVHFSVNRVFEIDFFSAQSFHAQLQLAFLYTLTREANWLHWTKSCVVYREPKHVVAVEQCSEPSNQKLRETMSWMEGPIDPPPPHPNLEVRTRSFYGAHNALPVQFWPHCHYENDAIVQIYELFGDVGRRFFRCPYYEVWYIRHLCFISWSHTSVNR